MSAITILDQNNTPTGPFTRGQVAEKLQAGEFTLDSLAFVEGLTQWTPLRDVLAKIDAEAAPATFVPPPAPAVGTSYAAPAAATSPYAVSSHLQPGASVRYAGFWLRFVAYLVDFVILDVPMTIISMILGFFWGLAFAASHPGEKVGFVNSEGGLNIPFFLFEVGIMAFSITVHWLYFALQESSAAQATVGKRVMDLKVTSLDGNRLSFGHASARFFSKIISGFTCLIGYIMAGFTERKQALHDIIASTLVIKG